MRAVAARIDAFEPAHLRWSSRASRQASPYRDPGAEREPGLDTGRPGGRPYSTSGGPTNGRGLSAVSLEASHEDSNRIASYDELPARVV
jgi:hypothetical protein